MKKIKFKGYKGVYEYDNQSEMYEGHLVGYEDEHFYGETKEEIEDEFRALVHNLLEG